MSAQNADNGDTDTDAPAEAVLISVNNPIDTHKDPAALTVPEAATQIGIHEKRLRRLLAKAEYKDRTQTQTRTTRTGERKVSVLPASLLADIQARLVLEADGAEAPANADNVDADADGDSAAGVSASTGTRTQKTGTQNDARQVIRASYYERLLLEKDARLSEMAAALEHEREQSRRLAEALAREQALRALPPPEVVMDYSHDRAAAEGSTQATRPWWVRLFTGS